MLAHFSVFKLNITNLNIVQYQNYSNKVDFFVRIFNLSKVNFEIIVSQPELIEIYWSIAFSFCLSAYLNKNPNNLAN